MSFVRAYSPRAALVLSREEIGVREINGTKIARVPHYFLRSPFCEPAAAPVQSPVNDARHDRDGEGVLEKEGCGHLTSRLGASSP